MGHYNDKPYWFDKNKIIHAILLSSFLILSAHGSAEEEQDSSISDYLNLGTSESLYDDGDFYAHDRTQIGNQIKTFIPPLLAPAIVQHGYILPPGSFRMDFSQRHISLDGDDFFKDGDINSDTFSNFSVDRQLSDLDFFYGFDLNRKYLHSFTLRVNIPFRNVQTNGSVNPNGQPFISLENAGSDSHLGDVGVFIKKKLLDQGNHGFGLAAAVAVFLPTGSNEATFGSNGRISARRPAAPNLTIAQGFDALQRANTAGDDPVWGSPACFFRNFNIANRELCNDAPSFSAPAGAVDGSSPGVLTFSQPRDGNPAGPNFANSHVGDFPFNNGIFGRFSGDGRLPAILQSGTGSTSFLFGLFGTRQFEANSFFGRSAFHAGFSHKFVSETDGIDPGDLTTYFSSFVKPLYKDFLSLDLSFIAFDREDDSYAGKIPEPEIHACNASDFGVITQCNEGNLGQDVFVFDLVDRPSFSGGLTGFIAPSIIFSPNPQLRLTLSTLFRVVEPDLGPAPESVFRFSISTIL